MTDKPSLIDFPCHFPIKIIGDSTPEFKLEITEIIYKHFPGTEESHFAFKDSQQGRYLSITVSVYVCDQATLDALYQDLTRHPATKMVL